ncbi:hypothetical protein [Actinomadura sp. 3N407]|uniref:hypothetical protein n=1 Tax=Actinomadura sp. 3N407 TaxID=3457423 RepID=UPI003FCE9568
MITTLCVMAVPNLILLRYPPSVGDHEVTEQTSESRFLAGIPAARRGITPAQLVERGAPAHGLVRPDGAETGLNGHRRRLRALADQAVLLGAQARLET